jgi:hypothetical protein
MLVPEVLWGALARRLVDGGRLRVRNGTRSADAPIEAAEIDGSTLTVRATFGEQEANFEWAGHEVLLDDGSVLDRTDVDYGRKAATSVTTLEVAMELEAR